MIYVWYIVHMIDVADSILLLIYYFIEHLQLTWCSVSEHKYRPSAFSLGWENISENTGRWTVI